MSEEKTLRGFLTTSLEVISLFTAVGIVLSAATYSLVFYGFGLNYLSIASISDIVKDGLRMLIMGIATIAITVPVFSSLAFDYSNFTTKRAIIASLIFVVLSTMIIACCGYIILSVAAGATVRLSEPQTLAFYLAAFLYCVFLWGVSYYAITLKKKRDQNPRRTPAGMAILWISFATIFLFGLSFSAFFIWQQFRDGLPISLRPINMEICGGEYVVSWLGESRMVAQCRATGEYVVAILG